LKLKLKTSFHIVPTKPFHFDSTFFKPAHFPSGDTKFESGKRWQTMIFEGKKLGVIFRGMKGIKDYKGLLGEPKIYINVYSEKRLDKEFLESLRKEVIWRYNLDLDLSDFYRMARKDELLKPIVTKFCGLRPMHAGSLYEYLIIAIVLQNATVKRSVYMMQTLFERYGTLLEFAGQKLYCFWEPKVLAQASEQKLRDLKMGYRAKSLIKVSQSFVEEKNYLTKNSRSCKFCKIDFDEISLRKKSQKEQESFLLSLYGIGSASVGYIMFDVFHQWDFLKYISPWEQKIYSKIFFNRSPNKPVSMKKMLKYFEKWGKWRNLAVHYVWENIWWQRRNKNVPWLEKLIRL